MRSQYFQNLSDQNKKRYLEKIKLIGDQDPYCLTSQDFTNDFNNLPQIRKEDISEYLLLRASPFTQEAIKCHKSLAAFAQVVCNWVKDIRTVKIKDKYLYIGKILHSERLNDVPLKPWIILNSKPKVLAAHCDCKAGLGEVCTHIAAVLYSLLERLPQESVTDRLAYWITPRLTDVHLSVGEIDFRTPTSLWKRSMKTSTREIPTKQWKNVLTKEKVNQFLKEYKEVAFETALHKILKPSTAPSSSETGAYPSVKSRHSTGKTVLDALRLNLSSPVNVDLPLTAQCIKEFEYFNKNIVITLENALNIAERTMDQNNAEWLKERRYRITASTCYSLYTYCSNKNPDWVTKIEKFLNPSFKGNVFTAHGKNYEQFARIRYEAQFGKIEKMGLVVNPSIPWIACSPDGLKMFQGHLYRLIEFKCPVAGATQGIQQLLNTLPYVKYVDGKAFPYHLNRKHMYFAQIQLSMAILNISLCDFCYL